MISNAATTLLDTDSDNWVKSFQRLNNLRALQDNWNGEGAVSPDQSTFEAASKWLSDLYNQGNQPAPTTILASVNGSIIFNWQENNYIELEFLGGLQAEFMEAEGNSEPKFKIIILKNDLNQLTPPNYVWYPVSKDSLDTTWVGGSHSFLHNL